MNPALATETQYAEVTALIAALHANVARLEELTGGEIDTITDPHGQPFLLRRAQAQVRLNDASRLDAILNSLPAYIAIVDADGVIMSVNHAWAAYDTPLALAAAGPGHAVGTNVLAQCALVGGEGADQARQVADGIGQVLNGRTRHWSFEYACSTGGIQSWLLLTVTPLADKNQHGVVVMYMDISERKRSEDELRRFRTAMDCTDDAIFLVNCTSMRFVELNAAASRMLGYSREELLDMGPCDITAESTWPDMAALYQRLMENCGSSLSDEMALIRKDGSQVQVEFHRQALASGPDWIIVAVVRDISERKEAALRLQYQAHHDGLTGLPNRTLFYDTLTRTLQQATQHGWTIAVLFLDLDNFKTVNDTLGHGVGDDLLVQFANRLLGCVRARDTVGRLGGDEFGVILVMQDELSDAAGVAGKIREVLRAPFVLGQHELNVTASIGITMHPLDASEPDELIKYADTAMYRAKQAGRDTFRFFTAQMNVEVLARLDLEKALRRAFENGEFVLHYQPKVALDSGCVAGLEALLRWERPGYGLVGPDRFIASLEETGLILKVGTWVIDEACRRIGQWLRSPVGPIQVSVNVAGRQLAEGDVDGDVIAALERHGVPPELLELELTESSLMVNTERTIKTLKDLKRHGVQISIDDFGTGYSSLAYLRRFPIDKLKIDIAFIREVTSNPDDAAIVQAILGMAHSLKLHVIAEGVETAAQLAFLKRNRCDQVQGYFFSRPLALPALEALLLNERQMQLPAPAILPYRKTLLLVDDDAHVLSSLRRLLRDDGYHILCAGSAAEGFDLLAQHCVQVIICDQRMPDMSGTEFFDRVKEMYQDSFRIVLSGYTDLDSIMKAVNKGAIYRFYTKPWDNEVLRADLREAFRHYGLLHNIDLGDNHCACPAGDRLPETATQLPETQRRPA
ncbi:EAL domain-containing protein [Massilia pseudoviolaceinigra]|uniref:EAL domain-containing protein n=1 Tax=Massilia pseudoviolaceinigra TaxID=3057165 RepID=UPI002796E19F|nr:EAL domain-containing protein [Massilia sp. CCM 9206]MDQ1923257.1 EAL domain-containing protein [Massilia sp. CCM 9206]